MPRQKTLTKPKTKRRTKKQFKPPKFLRVLLALTLIAAGLCCTAAVVKKISKPYVISYGESKEVRDIRKQIAVATADNQQLKRDISYLGTAQGKEAEARKLGWVKKGEVALVVQQPGKSSFQVDQPIAIKDTFWQSAGKRLVGIFVRRH